MCHGILQMALIPQLVGADPDPVVRVEAARLALFAAAAAHVAAVYVAAELVDVVTEEADDGACLGICPLD